MPKQTISKDQVLDTAYRIASEDGISSMSVRRLASECGIAVGSVYNYFPAKTDLIAAVMDRFFANTFYADFCHINPGEGFVAYVSRLYHTMLRALSTFKTDWIQELRRLPAAEREAGRKEMAARFKHIETGLAKVMEADPRIDVETLPDELKPNALCSFIFETIVSSFNEERSCEPLFAMLERALYGHE